MRRSSASVSRLAKRCGTLTEDRTRDDVDMEKKVDSERILMPANRTSCFESGHVSPQKVLEMFVVRVRELSTLSFFSFVATF
jgi:hypothetical protein